VWAEHHLPNTLEVHGKKVKIVFIALVHMVVIRGMRFFERKLESLLSTIRQKTRMPQGTGEASMFLRQVSDHKRALVREVSSESR
jgi:hypothetical protein